jgi:hypothetical protein
MLGSLLTATAIPSTGWPGATISLSTTADICGLKPAAEDRGLINFLLHEHRRTIEQPAAMPLPRPDEGKGAVRSYLRHVADIGCVGTIEWKRRVYPLGPFYRSRFFPYPRAVNLVSWTFNPGISLAGIRGVYEVQI